MKISNLTQNLIIFSALIIVGALIVSRNIVEIRTDINRNF